LVSHIEGRTWSGVVQEWGAKEEEGRKKQDAEGNQIMRIFMIFASRYILSK
jgi:hypothetical protein